LGGLDEGMDYSRVSLSDQVGRVLVQLQGDYALEIERIGGALNAILADRTKTAADKHLAVLQHQAAQDGISWALEQAAKYYTPIGGDGS
jgi:hypothetical protein